MPGVSVDLISETFDRKSTYAVEQTPGLLSYNALKIHTGD